MPFSDEDLKRLKERFFAKTIKSPKCWSWIGAKGSNGYGQMQFGERKQQAHRIAYQLFVGNIASGLTVDHICRKKDCVNPGHLRLMTMLENVMDGCVNAKKDHCPKGHPYNKSNTFRYRTFRYCRACKRVKDRKRWAKIKDKRNAERRKAYREACGK